MTLPGDDFLLIGTIVAPHGVRGEVKVMSATDRPDAVRRVKQIYIGSTYRLLHLRRFVEHKPGVLILGFEEVRTREEAEALRGRELFIAESDAAPLEEDEYFLHQLPGMEVVTIDGVSIGRVSEVLVTGANEVLVIKAEQREVLVPMIKEVVKRLDLDGGVIEIDPLPDML
ncbi:MAG: ribosome maturation factor RimM [Herpetosiphonaceae bacterium]|nr:MAG: ribosome maturation factor RimM [Herpetosiphonaceae bacterium]